MMQKRKIHCFFNIIMLVFIMNILAAPALFSQNTQEIEVTIGGVSSSDKLIHFNNGEELRKKMKFAEAIIEYMKVLNGGELCGKEAEAHYDIGICYTWMGKKEKAEAIFQEVLKTYPKNGEVIAHTNYCLAWIDVQKGEPKAAIERLQKTLTENVFSGEEFCSRAQFFIGRIYLSYINDNKMAEQAFQKLLEQYPNSKMIDHPFVQKLKGD